MVFIHTAHFLFCQDKLSFTGSLTPCRSGLLDGMSCGLGALGEACAESGLHAAVPVGPPGTQICLSPAPSTPGWDRAPIPSPEPGLGEGLLSPHLSCARGDHVSYPPPYTHQTEGRVQCMGAALLKSMRFTALQGRSPDSRSVCEGARLRRKDPQGSLGQKRETC